MYHQDEYVIHGVNGVCQIEDITDMMAPGGSGFRSYYVMRPINAGSSRIYTPVDNDKVTMRRILTKKEAEAFIEELPYIEAITVPSEKQREETYKEIMKTCDCRQWVGMMKALFLRRQRRLAEGRKFTTVDERYLKAAETHLFSELSIALGEERERAQEIVINKLETAADKK